MKILSVDTTVTSCSVAIVDRQGVVVEEIYDSKDTHSKHLLRIIDKILETGGLDISEIDLFAVSTGPGSFTGLRIGLSTVKGLAYATGTPVIGVSSLKALALGGIGYNRQICSLIDARRNEVYAALFRYEDGELISVSDEKVTSPEALMRTITEDTVFIGSGVEVYGDIILRSSGIKALIAGKECNIIRAGFIGRLALSDYDEGRFSDASDITPQYIRKSDAETDLEKKLREKEL